MATIATIASSDPQFSILLAAVGFIDAEYSLNRSHAIGMGVDPDRFVVYQPSSGEDGIAMVEEMVNYFTYDYPQPEGEHPFTVSTELSTCPWNSSHQLMLVGLQGKEIDKENLPPSNLVFLLDVSGSMSAHNKLPLLKSAFMNSMDSLLPYKI